MLVRRLVCLSAATILVGLANIASAENGMPQESTLSAMGLSGLQVMSDNQSMDVRGRGYGGYYYYNPQRYAKAYGSSYANVATHGASAGSHDGYYAESPYYASGASGSVAGYVIQISGGHHGGPYHYKKPAAYGGGGHGGGYHPKPKTKAVTVFAGGFSFAHTK